MPDLDADIRRRREQEGRRAAEMAAPCDTIDPRLEDLLGLLDASDDLRLEGITAHAANGRIALKRHGEAYGEWLIYDAWFEYRSRMGDEQAYKVAWTERAIALTSSIVTGVHGATRDMTGRPERSRFTFSVKQDRGCPLAAAVHLVDGDIPSLGSGQLAFTLPDGLVLEGARRIVRHLNQNILALTFKRLHG
jgi:hypothetical protein